MITKHNIVGPTLFKLFIKYLNGVMLDNLNKEIIHTLNYYDDSKMIQS